MAAITSAFCQRLCSPLFGMLIMLLDPLVDEENSQKLLGVIALGGAVAACLPPTSWRRYPGLAFWNMVKVDASASSFTFCDCASGRRDPQLVMSTWKSNRFAPGNITD